MFTEWGGEGDKGGTGEKMGKENRRRKKEEMKWEKKERELINLEPTFIVKVTFDLLHIHTHKHNYIYIPEGQ